jgi:hypothetical protein
MANATEAGHAPGIFKRFKIIHSQDRIARVQKNVESVIAIQDFCVMSPQ